MTEEEQTAKEPERTVPPASARRSERTVHPRPSNQDEDEAADDRTSPFPYAKNFDEWVADETADPDRREHPSDVRHADDQCGVIDPR